MAPPSSFAARPAALLVTVLSLASLCSALAPPRPLVSKRLLRSRSSMMAGRIVRRATEEGEGAVAVAEEEAAADSASASFMDALNPFKEDVTATERVKRQEEEIGGKIDPILSTAGIKERLSDPNKVAGTGEKSLFKKIGPNIFFSGFPIIIGLFGYQEFAKTGFDVTVPIRLVVETLLILAPVIWLIDQRAKSQGRELDFSKKDD